MAERQGRPGGESLGRALAFTAWVDDQVAAERLEIPLGTGVFDVGRPLVWDSNYVRVGEGGGDLDPAALTELVEPLFAERGLAHRQVVMPARADRAALQGGFEALGWRPAHEVVMALSHRPEPPAHPVSEVSFAELRGPVRDVALIEPPGAADPAIVPDLVDQLMSGDELVAAAIAERPFVVKADGAPVAWCRLYAGDGIGQVEQVMTHPAHRNRGYARAVVSAAARASRDRGDQLTFLVADADDWPRQMYRRLGFEALGVRARFRRMPPRGGSA